MAIEQELIDFAAELQQEITERCERAASDTFKETEFAQIFLEYLIDAGEIEDGAICQYEKGKVKCDGYNLDEDEELLDIFVVDYAGLPEPKTITKDQVTAVFKRAALFVEECKKKLFENLEEGDDSYYMAKRIYEARRKLGRIRFWLMTDSVATSLAREDQEIAGVLYSYQTWDIRRLSRCAVSHEHREPLQIDFMTNYGESLACIPLLDMSEDYDACLAVIPGYVLYELYKEYGSKLLERNVRAFLQARPKVNKGIIETIAATPERFFAYNNGISATVESIEYSQSGGAWAIKGVTNLQIVNGGQTTACIYHAFKKYPDQVRRINVQAKISRIKKPELMDAVVPLIARYANSQNKVSDADLFANEKFHVEMERLSRVTWTPFTPTKTQSKWYYERTRGQYAEAKALGKKASFEKEYPTNQLLTKTELARYELAWAQKPHYVALGAQKAFRKFTDSLDKDMKEDSPSVSVNDFKDSVSKAILFQRATEMIKKKKLGGSAANAVAYTISFMCYRFNQSGKQINLDEIWRSQSLSSELEAVIDVVSNVIHEELNRSPEKKLITEWAKSEKCWDAIKALAISLPEVGTKDLIDISHSLRAPVASN